MDRDSGAFGDLLEALLVALGATETSGVSKSDAKSSCGEVFLRL